MRVCHTGRENPDDRDSCERGVYLRRDPIHDDMLALGAGRSLGSAPSGASPKVAQALLLQRLVGNRVAARLLSPTRGRTLQRWVGSEHERIGNATGASIDLGRGIVLTWGQVVAIGGDEYGSVEELLAHLDTAPGRQTIAARLKHAGVAPGEAASVAGLETPTSEQLADTSRWFDLLLHNVSHFAAGGTALQTWRSHHGRALNLALQAGLDDDERLWQRAQLIEAFGQHFLTDMFSAGHVRTPRAEITRWYTQEFAPRVMARLADRLSEAMVPHLPADMPRVPDELEEWVKRNSGRIRTDIRESLDVLDDLAPRFGLYVAGAISGTLHDIDNREGVHVVSDAQPSGWLTFGDEHLMPSWIFDRIPERHRGSLPPSYRGSPESLDQASRAVVAAREQLLRARELGRAERGSLVHVPGTLPTDVYFDFDSDELKSDAKAAVDVAGAFLESHRQVAVELVGHADPRGTRTYNIDLGSRRAHAVAQRLLAEHDVDAAQIHVDSMGEKSAEDVRRE